MRKILEGVEIIDGDEIAEESMFSDEFVKIEEVNSILDVV